MTGQSMTGQPTAAVARAVAALADRWPAVLASDPQVASGGGDFACSPAGLWLAAAAVAAGSGGTTAAELRGLLGVAGPEAAQLVTETVAAMAATDALVCATGLWSRVPVRREFREALPDVGFGTLDTAALGGLDAWVERATGGVIRELPLRPDERTLALLVNALALTARWEWPFDPALTAPRPFTDAAGRVRETPMMWRSLSGRETWRVPGRDATVVELRCAVGPAGGSPALVRCVLGAPGDGAARVLPAAWAPAAERAPVEADTVRVGVPRLELDSTVELVPQLAALGVREMATTAADFSGLSPEPLMFDRAVQRCVLSLTEREVRAAAVTVFAGRFGGAPPAALRRLTVVLDRPFGVAVLDGSGSLPLFAAWQASVPRPP
ncbi:serpin family protein, partial [Streptomyces otsuchiensis]|uniref:serpin family protein n=1 Tax=Streptomyces otsuchiensis TaxID=2681388 RepID=UPI001D130B34